MPRFPFELKKGIRVEEGKCFSGRFPSRSQTCLDPGNSPSTLGRTLEYLGTRLTPGRVRHTAVRYWVRTDSPAEQRTFFGVHISGSSRALHLTFLFSEQIDSDSFSFLCEDINGSRACHLTCCSALHPQTDKPGHRKDLSATAPSPASTLMDMSLDQVSGGICHCHFLNNHLHCPRAIGQQRCAIDSRKVRTPSKVERGQKGIPLSSENLLEALRLKLPYPRHRHHHPPLRRPSHRPRPLPQSPARQHVPRRHGPRGE